MTVSAPRRTVENVLDFLTGTPFTLEGRATAVAVIRQVVHYDPAAWRATRISPEDEIRVIRLFFEGHL